MPALEAVRLVGPRVVVRTTRPEDAAALVAYFDRNRAHLAPWEPDYGAEFYTEPFWAERLRAHDEDRARGLAHRLVLETEDIVGVISLTSILARAPVWNARVGYSLDGAHEGKGLMSDALGLVIRYTFDTLGLKRLLAGFMPSNTRSARVLERAGFVREGYYCDFLYISGRWEDHVETSLINAAWRPPERT